MPFLINIYELSYYLNFIIYLIYTHANILHNKYVKKNDIILYTVNCNKYDKIHDLTIVYYLFNIQIYSYRNKKTNYKRNIIYKDNIKLSDITFIKEIPINNKKMQIILHLVFLDNLSYRNFQKALALRLVLLWDLARYKIYYRMFDSSRLSMEHHLIKEDFRLSSDLF